MTISIVSMTMLCHSRLLRDTMIHCLLMWWDENSLVWDAPDWIRIDVSIAWSPCLAQKDKSQRMRGCFKSRERQTERQTETDRQREKTERDRQRETERQREILNNHRKSNLSMMTMSTSVQAASLWIKFRTTVDSVSNVISPQMTMCLKKTYQGT